MILLLIAILIAAGVVPAPGLPRSLAPLATRPLALVGSFDATDFATPARPPDAAVAAGPDHLLVATNDSVSLYAKSGRLYAGLPIDRFFASVLPDGEEVTDPRAIYDPQARRYLLAAVAFTSSSHCSSRGCATQFLLAVSRTESPSGMGGSDWYLFQLPPERGPQTGQLSELDFPSITVTARWVVLTADIYTERPSHDNAGSNTAFKVRLLDKAELLAGSQPSHWTDVDDLHLASGDVPSAQPAIAPDGSPDVYLAAYAGACRLRIWRLGGELTAPRVETAGLSADAGYNCDDVTPNADQPGSPQSLETDGPDLSSRPIYRGGAIWLAHTVRVDSPSGRSSAVHWVQLDVRSFPSEVRVVQQGLIKVGGGFAFYPALTVGGSGGLAIVYGASGAQANPQVRLTGRLAGDRSGRLRPGTAVKVSGSAQATSERDDTSVRYGDYFDMALDPSDGTAWLIGEYAKTSDQWGMWAGHVAWRTG